MKVLDSASSGAKRGMGMARDWNLDWWSYVFFFRKRLHS
jgi:hypothetical protein